MDVSQDSILVFSHSPDLNLFDCNLATIPESNQHDFVEVSIIVLVTYIDTLYRTKIITCLHLLLTLVIIININKYYEHYSDANIINNKQYNNIIITSI